MADVNMAVFLSALGLGFFGSAHCIAMCGGICSALSFALPAGRPWLRLLILLGYNIGRISSYVLMAVILSAVSLLLANNLSPEFAQNYLSGLRLVAGILLIAMGLYLTHWWLGLQYLEKSGQKIWRFFAPLAQRLAPVKYFHTAVLYGAVWGWLPCGLVYSALALSVTQSSLASSASVMLAFGLGTLPALLATGLLAERVQKLLNSKALKTLFGVLLIGFGVWTMLYGGGHHDHGSLTNSTDSPHHDHSHHH